MPTVKIDYRGHTPECVVTAARVSLLGDIAEIYAQPHDGRTEAYEALAPLLGAAIEYYGGGDQEEDCTCGGYPPVIEGTCEEIT